MALFLLVASAAGNLLSGFGFEDWDNDSTATGWVVVDRASLDLRPEAETVHTGERSARVAVRTGGSGTLVQRIAVQGGEWHRLLLRCFEDSPELEVAVTVSWFRADSGFIRSSRPMSSVDLPGWQVIDDSVRSPAGSAWADFCIELATAGRWTEERRAFVDEAWFGEAGNAPGLLEAFFAPDSLADRLVEFFSMAKRSLDCCFYNLSRPDVHLALVHAHDRGVRIRLVTDNSRLDDEWVRDLRQAGIAVWSDSIGPGPSGLMHNKFAVRDAADEDASDDVVWTGSYNPNLGDLRADNVLVIPHAGLAAAYLAEFEQMWGGSGDFPDPARARFHGGKTDVLPVHDFELDGQSARVFFAPQDRVVDTITRVAGQALNHVLFGVFAFTWDDLGDQLVEHWNSGVRVEGVIDKSGVGNQGSEFPKLVEAGIPVYADSVRFGEKIIHEKLMVIDSLITIAGSANWSNNANTSNDENTIILDHPALARRFVAELEERYREAGGTGIVEDRVATLLRRSPVTLLRSTGLVIEPGAALIDATGRAASGPVRPGVYYTVRGGRVLRRFVVVR